MAKFDEFFLMNTEDVKEYAVKLKLFSPEDNIISEEIGDGNINYVFRLHSETSDKSVVIKQADRLLRSSGRPLDTHRSQIEAGILQLQDKFAPGFVPKVYHYDEIMCALSMEDISACKNLRKELATGRTFPKLAEHLSDFVSSVLLPTTDLVMDRAEKKKLAAFYTNPQLCDISEDLVFTEPYYDYKGRNIIFPGNEDFVREFLYEDNELHYKVAKLRDKFMNKSQALIHGDLHTGSIFVNEESTKIIDPEFAFYGPMAYDIGNIIGNLYFAYANKLFTQPENKEFLSWISGCIAEFFELCRKKLGAKYDELVSFPLYKVEEFKADYIDSIMRDSLSYAGTEIIRRTVGDSKVSDICSVTDADIRIPMERLLICLGIELIKNPSGLPNITEML